MIFATHFRRVSAPSAALGANLIGAVAGGLLEYGSLLVGQQALFLGALAFYLLSMAIVAATGRTRASLIRQREPRGVRRVRARRSGGSPSARPIVHGSVADRAGRASAGEWVPLRTTIGVDGIDALIEGGVPRGASVLIAGEAGAGKSVLCTQFILAGIREGEPGVYATADHPNRVNRGGIRAGLGTCAGRSTTATRA